MGGGTQDSRMRRGGQAEQGGVKEVRREQRRNTLRMRQGPDQCRRVRSLGDRPQVFSAKRAREVIGGVGELRGRAADGGGRPPGIDAPRHRRHVRSLRRSRCSRWPHRTRSSSRPARRQPRDARARAAGAWRPRPHRPPTHRSVGPRFAAPSTTRRRARWRAVGHELFASRRGALAACRRCPRSDAR